MVKNALSFPLMYNTHVLFGLETAAGSSLIRGNDKDGRVFSLSVLMLRRRNR